MSSGAYTLPPTYPPTSSESNLLNNTHQLRTQLTHQQLTKSAAYSETNSELNLLTKSVAYTQKITNRPTQTIPSFCKGGRSLTKNAMHTEKFKISELNLIFFRAVGVEIGGINSSRNVFVCLRASVF